MVAIHPMARTDQGWLYDAATDYFAELVPDQAGPPLTEIIDWFTDPDAHPFVISTLSGRVGFALIEQVGPRHDLSEFCILPDQRGTGIGTRAARLCFAHFPGPWTLGVANALPGTAAFWDRLLPTLPGITGLARGPALTSYQCHSYTFDYKGAP